MVPFVVWLLGGGPPAQAQDDPQPRLLVEAVRFEHPGLLDETLLRARVRTRANRRFLGLPGATWWLWLYRLGESETLGARLSRGLRATGEPPAYFEPTLVAADVERLRLLYEQEGYRSAEVAARIDTTAAGERVRVLFAIDPGAATYVRSVRYEGLAVVPQSVRRQVVSESLLRPPSRGAEAEDTLAFSPRRQRFAEPTLVAERSRLLTLLRNAGYAAVSRDSIRAFVVPARPDSFDVTFRLRTGPRYRFGDVRFEVEGPEPGAAVRTDTLQVEEGGGLVTWRIADERKLAPDVLRRTLRMEPGAWYRQDRLLATKRRLENTGVFSFSDLTPLWADTTLRDSVPHLPIQIDLRTRRRHQLRVETFVLQRSVVLAGADDELGTGVGLSYANANAFGGGETFSVRTTGSVAADLDSTFFNAAQAEVQASVVLPYLIQPFGRLDAALGLFGSRTRLSLGLLTARRDELGLIIRGRGGARLRLELQHRPTLTSFVDLLDLSLSNPDTTSNFALTFLGELGDADSLSVAERIRRAQILEDYTQPQIGNALRYTLRASTINPLRREQGYSYELAAEVGGNLPYLLDRYVFSPGTTEGSLPGLPVFGGSDVDDRLLYRQYARLVTDLRRYRPTGRRSVFAAKLIAGVAQPFGQATVVPFDRRFYSGGASSVRGWRLRELGPGPASFSDADDGTAFLGGEVKLEASTELRTTVLRNVLAADWIGALFTDVGNVWFGPRNPGLGDEGIGVFRLDAFATELGVGSGVGVRIAWDYLIVRLDLAYRVHDPEPGEGWFAQPARRPTPYFGIGHAF